MPFFITKRFFGRFSDFVFVLRFLFCFEPGSVKSNFASFFATSMLTVLLTPVGNMKYFQFEIKKVFYSSPFAKA